MQSKCDTSLVIHKHNYTVKCHLDSIKEFSNDMGESQTFGFTRGKTILTCPRELNSVGRTLHNLCRGCWNKGVSQVTY